MKYVKCITDSAIGLTRGKIYRLLSIEKSYNELAGNFEFLFEMKNDKSVTFKYRMKEFIENDKTIYIPAMRRKFDHNTKWFVDATVENRDRMLKQLFKSK